MGLNQNQERAVTITLRLLEERLGEIERLVLVNERGILYTRVARFLPRQRQTMLASINELRALIKRVSELFGLACQDQDPAHRIVGLLSVTWESVEEIHSHHLGAYGQVNPQLRETLDPWVEKMTRLILELERVAQQEK